MHPKVVFCGPLYLKLRVLAPDDALPARLVGQVLASEAGDVPEQALEAAVLTVCSTNY